MAGTSPDRTYRFDFRGRAPFAGEGAGLFVLPEDERGFAAAAELSEATAVGLHVRLCGSPGEWK